MSAPRHLTLVLTLAQARGLLALAGEGREGLLTDAEAAKAYVGNPSQQAAAERGYHALHAAVAKAQNITLAFDPKETT
jgi:hypothetical protein